jgi:sulfite exporter TauE/SafE
MTAFLLATLVASLVGSLHCAGMCGPFVLIASGTEDRARRLAMYHVGRLVTYASLGAVAGAAGSMADQFGSTLGLQRFIAFAVGGSLVAWGLVLALRVAGVPLPHAGGPQFVGRAVQAGFRRVKHWPKTLHAAAIGALSGFLPCGWLYLFVLAAAGTGRSSTGSGVMIAFWLGTLPVLTALAAGFAKLSQRHRKFIPAATAIVCLVAGAHTLWARATADLTTLHTPASVGAAPTMQELPSLTKPPLPCCRHVY